MSDNGAAFSPCRTWRYLLWRKVAEAGPLFVYIGVNGSTADETNPDQTVRKWTRFTADNGGRGFLVINPFAFCATDVKELATAADPVGPNNQIFIDMALQRADIIVPCWGNRSKVPITLRSRFITMRRQIVATKKPIKVFGLTRAGDPKHPLMLSYATQLVDWNP